MAEIKKRCVKQGCALKDIEIVTDATECVSCDSRLSSPGSRLLGEIFGGQSPEDVFSDLIDSRKKPRP